jgi:hypothetical protein
MLTPHQAFTFTFFITKQTTDLHNITIIGEFIHKVLEKREELVRRLETTSRIAHLVKLLATLNR